MAECNNLQGQGLASFQHLWTVFKPGSTVYGTIYGQPRAFQLLNYSYSCNPSGLNISLEYVDFDGEDFGTRRTNHLIEAFEGAEPIRDLSVFPLDWHPTRDAVERQLVARGKRWEEYAGTHFGHYNGIALEMGRYGVTRYSVDGRVVVDTKTSHRLGADSSFTVASFKSGKGKSKKQARLSRFDYDIDDNGDEEEGEPVELLRTQATLPSLTDQQRLLATATVRGFSFTEKRWLDFFIDNVSAICWNEDCFEQLVLPEAQKDLVQSLVATHAQQKKTGGFDDIVKGKGRGLIFVLHGPPGKFDQEANVIPRLIC